MEYDAGVGSLIEVVCVGRALLDRAGEIGGVPYVVFFINGGANCRTAPPQEVSGSDGSRNAAERAAPCVVWLDYAASGLAHYGVEPDATSPKIPATPVGEDSTRRIPDARFPGRLRPTMDGAMTVYGGERLRCLSKEARPLFYFISD